MTTLEATFNQLPKPILDKLQLMVRRVRRLLFIRGIFATLAVALICVLAIMALDATLTIFSNTVRWTLSLSGLASTCATAWWFLLRPLSRKITLTHIARILEIRHPELQERISTAVELMSSDDPNSIKGSEELIEAVVDSAVIDVEAVDPKTEFKPARAKKFITTTGICLGLIALLLVIWPAQSWTLLARALAPFLDIGNAYADTLVIDPGDVRVAQGSSVTISMTINHKRLRRAEVRRRLADGSESVERMIFVGETDEGHKRFALIFPKVDESFEYRIRAGSAVSEFFDVETVPLPVVDELKIRYDYPEYTRSKAEESISKTGEIRALANTNVTVTATVNKAVWSSKLLFNEHQEIGDPVSKGNTITWNFPLKPRMNGTWQLDLSDADGFKNADTSYPIQSLPDKAPTVQITSPVAREIRVKPTELLPIKYAVIEDFGFAQIALLVTANGEVAPRELIQPTPETDNKPGVWRGMAQLDISALDLKPHHNKLTVQVRARDNRPESLNGPGEGISETITIFLDKKAQSLAKQAIAEDKKNLEQAIREAHLELAKAKAEINNAERELQRDKEFSERARVEVKDFNERKKQGEEKLQKAAEKLQDGAFKKQAEALADIVKNELTKAQEAADMIPVTDGQKERVAEAKEVAKQVDQAITDLKEVSKSIRESESERNMIAGLNDLANDQREIARDAAKRNQQKQSKAQAKNQPLTPQQQKQMREFQAKQKQVQKKLGEMLKENAAALEAILKQQQQESMELSEEAKQLAKEQQDLKELNQQSTAKPQKKGDLKKQLIAQLQKEQKEIAAETEQQQEKSNSAMQAQIEKPISIENEIRPLEEAKRQTESASKNLQSETLAQAMKEAKEAGKSLAEAAAEAKDSQPPDSKSDAQQEAASATEQQEKGQPLPAGNEDAKALADLAERQETVAEQIAAVEAGNLQEALALMEEQLADESKSLQTEAQAIEDTLENLKQATAKSRADQAGRSLQQAEAKADAAAKQLQQAQKAQQQADQQGKTPPGELAKATQQAMQRSQPTQQQTENYLKQASQAMAQSAEAIGQTLKGLDPSDMGKQAMNSEDLAKSFEDVTESAKSQDAKEAAEQSQQAAQSLQELAQAAMEKLGDLKQGPANQNDPSQEQEEGRLSEETSQDLNESGKKTADAFGDGIPPALKELGISLEDWTRFKGVLSGGSATAIESDLPEEYRELVGRYFQVIAKEAGK